MRRALVVLSVALGACASAPPSRSVAALPSESGEKGPEPGRYVVDAARARFDVFGAGTIAGHYRLRFPEWRAVVVLAQDRTARLDVTIDTRSVEVDKKAALGIVRDHLLEVERFPVAALTATLRPTDAAGGFEIDGVADLHGVRQRLRFPGRLRAAPEGYTFHTEVKISRKAFGIRYAPIEPLVKDEVRIVVHALVRPEAAPDAGSQPAGLQPAGSQPAGEPLLDGERGLDI